MVKWSGSVSDKGRYDMLPHRDSYNVVLICSALHIETREAFGNYRQKIISLRFRKRRKDEDDAARIILYYFYFS